ncbi:hypothetical protein F9005_22665, partial [Escherichia coli]
MQFQGVILLSSAESIYKRAVCWFARRKKFSVAQIGVRLENGIYGHSRFCNTDFDDKLACLNL